MLPNHVAQVLILASPQNNMPRYSQTTRLWWLLVTCKLHKQNFTLILNIISALKRQRTSDFMQSRALKTQKLFILCIPLPEAIWIVLSNRTVVARLYRPRAFKLSQSCSELCKTWYISFCVYNCSGSTRLCLAWDCTSNMVVAAATEPFHKPSSF